MSFLDSIGGGLNLGSIGSLVGGMMGGPLGAQIGNVVGQLCTGVIENALKDAGVCPNTIEKFMDAMQGQMPGCSPARESFDQLLGEVMEQLNPMDQCELENGMDALRNFIIKAAVEGMGEEGDSKGGSGSDSETTSSGSGDFFTAMAKALGEALQSQADHVKDISNQVSTATKKANSAEGKDAKSDAQNNLMELQTQLSAESQRLSYMAQGVQTALSSIGSALSTLGRKS